MGAQYFMGTRQGKSKSSGSDYWALMIFRKNRFKSYEVTQCFIDEDTYRTINSKGLALGTPVTLQVADVIDGQVSDIAVDTSFVALNLDERSKANPVQYATTKGG